MPRRNSKHLTDAGIAKIGKAPPSKRVERFDAGVPCLCLRITDKGAKSWSVYYRLYGKHRRETIGAWPAVGVTAAREQAREIKDQAKAGIDPSDVKKAARAEPEDQDSGTFKAVAERYIKRECSRLKRGGDLEGVIRRELVPEWGEHQIAEIRRGDLTKLTDKLLDAEKPMAAHKLHEVTKRIFNWALDRGDVEASPFAAMRAPVRKETRDRALKNNEIKVLWSAWEGMAYPFGRMMQMLLLTGQRRSEVAGMRWSEVDLDKAEWTIPAERSKSKRKHLVPLSTAVVEILGSLPRFTEGDHVFTTTSGRRPISGFSKAKRRVSKLLDEDEKIEVGVDAWRLHDLRRTVRTGMARLGAPEIVGERVLNHIPRGLSRIYNVHEYLDEKRDALARWAQEVESIMEPPPDNVVRLMSKN